MNREFVTSVLPSEQGENAQTSVFVMICDVSEFVKIAGTHRHFYGSKIGAEKTRLWLDQVFDQILSCIELNQGQTIQFIGDAIVARFPAESATHVIQCAQEIRLACDAIQAGQITHQFTQIKTGIALGPVETYQSGQFAQHPLAMALGPAMGQALRALQNAGPRDIVCDTSTLEATKHIANGGLSTPVGVGFHKIRVHEDTPLPYLPQVVQPHLETADSQNEIKLLTILYIEFGLATPEQIKTGWLDDLFGQIHSLGSMHNATLIGACQTLRGLRLQVAIGHLKSEINDVELAVQFASRFQGKATHAVIGYGHAWQGRYGGKNLKLFNAHGAEVNLAARILEKFSQGPIYLTENASQQLNDALPLIEQEGLPIKGEADSVKIFRIPQAHEINSQREFQSNALHGRTDELKKTLNILNGACLSGESCCIEITGEAGVGKSTFVRSIQSTLVSQGRTVIELRSSPHSNLVPYSVAFPLIVELSKLYKASSPETWLEKTVEIDTTLSGWLGLICLITPLKLKPSPFEQQASPEIKTRAITHIFTSLINKANRDFKPVFIVEDLQWFDITSTQILLDGIFKTPACQSIYTIRTSENNTKTGELLARLGQLKTSRYPLPLLKFQPEETAHFLLKWFDVETVPTPLMEALHRLSEGNLLLLTTLTQRLLQDNIVRKSSNARLEIDHPRLVEFSAIPVNLEHALQAKTDQLSPRHRQVLAHCSIFKSAFTAQELRAAFSYPDHTEVEQALSVLQQRKLLQPTISVPGKAQFRFEHQVIEQCVYDRIPFEERKKLHQKFATWLEAQIPPAEQHTNKRLVIRLAAQYDWAGLLDKAFPLSQQAADYAFEVGALDDALERLNKLIKWHENNLLPHTSNFELACWLEKKAQIFFAQGQFNDASTYYKRALFYTTHSRSMPEKISALRGKASFAMLYLQQRWLDRRPKKLARAESLLALRIYTCLSELGFYMGEGFLGHMYLIRGIEMSRRLIIPTGDLAKAYAGCAIISQIYGFDACKDFFTNQAYRCLDNITDQKEKLRAHAHINHRIGYMVYSSGNFELALELITKSVEAARLSQEFQTEVLAFSTVVTINVAQGRFEDALTAYAIYEELAKKYASAYFNLFHQYGLLNQRVYALAMLDRLPEARQTLQFLEEKAVELNFNPVSMMAVGRCKLMVLYREQNWPAARRLALHFGKNLKKDAEEKSFSSTCISLPLEVLLEAEQHHYAMTAEEQVTALALLKKLEIVQRKFTLVTPAYLILNAQWQMRKRPASAQAKKDLHKARHLAVRYGQRVEQEKAENLLAGLAKS